MDFSDRRLKVFKMLLLAQHPSLLLLLENFEKRQQRESYFCRDPDYPQRRFLFYILSQNHLNLRSPPRRTIFGEF